VPLMQAISNDVRNAPQRRGFQMRTMKLPYCLLVAE
jgi:hypothetical protein